ncbi:diphosphomevalonate decarboxylase [Leuconostoc suionicum]|uniref:diphosphomevalonate decarboxylase n=1 Tax=Leuconostoc suionicum TaxID=1511761 RepID=UPI00233E95D1|nr:diphosphomevalonate decarboxylase [Leuconostoc suionicum]MDC2806399.1 diphosphomevalonate decarboxylase [Leuconostoc suionicum]MDC2823911.1 diphosphomevalonate decarboxylase [Leuconostoc suionicum]
MDSTLMKATAHTNIALIKYWGKKNTELNLPTTSSLSLTLDKFYTTTSVEPSNHDCFILNNQVVDATRVHRFLDILRQQLGDFTPLQVVSENHVPTSAGLASSASAFAALTGAVTHELGMDLSKEKLSRLARRGSGSASRSFFGNFAMWHKGIDDASSFAESLNAPELPIALVVAEVCDAPKKITSTEGMKRAVTSPNYDHWLSKSANQFIDMQHAILDQDIDKIGALAEDNALGMHALNLTATKSPFTYFTDKTQLILSLIQDMRHQGILAYATIDAGPNVKIITTTQEAPKIATILNHAIPSLKLEIAQSGPGISYD